MILTEAEAAKRLTDNTEPVIQWLNSYTPHHTLVSRRDWHRRVGNFVRLHTARIVDGELGSVKRTARELARIAGWQAPRMPLLDIEVVLDPAEVDRFSRYLRACGVNQASVNTTRSVLRNLGRSLTKDAPWEPNPAMYQRQLGSPPYTPREVRLIERDAPRQATARRISDARALTGLGFGVGLDGRWVDRIRGTDIRRVRSAVVVAVPDPHAREVVVRREYEDELMELAQAAGNAPLVGIGSSNKNAVNRITGRIEIDRGRIKFSPRRARNTFILAHLNAGTHPDVLRKACGLETFDALRDLFPFMDQVAHEEAVRQLRDA